MIMCPFFKVPGRFAPMLLFVVFVTISVGSIDAQAQRTNQRLGSLAHNTTNPPGFHSEPRRNKVSALKPRLRISSTTTPISTTTTSTFGALQRRHRGTSPPTTTPSPTQPVDFDLDVLDQSPSDYASFLVWPVPRRQPARRIRGPVGTTTTTNKPLVKLLQPKPTRPSLYSLDGFVPKPSLNYVFTTEANPTYHVPAFDLQTLGSSFKRKQVKFPNSAEQYERRRNKAYTNTNPSLPIASEAARNRKAFRSRFGSYARKGVPGQDYPVFDSIPKTDFDCSTKPGPGRFADPQAGCQVWHLCPGNGSPHRHSFLCPNGTTFSESKGICDWWYNVHCELPAEDINPRRYRRSKDSQVPAPAVVQESRQIAPAVVVEG